MSEHFIKEIEIKNYKLFKDFKAEGFGRVNLIGGKNNVGKTAFMEACFLSTSKKTSELFDKLLEIKTHRNAINNLLSQTTREEDIHKLIKENIAIEILTKGKGGSEVVENKENGKLIDQEYREWDDGLVKITFDSNIKIYTKYTEINVGPPYYTEDSGEEYREYPDIYKFSDLVKNLDFHFESTKMKFGLNFISPFSNSNKELENIIGDSKIYSKYELINKYLLEVFNVSNIDIIKNKPMLKTENGYRELSDFGQGIKTFINTIGSIMLLEDDVMFIDEFENGIHYANLDKLWEIILSISKQQNVQVFATTHSKECIESYARVAKKLEDEDITYTILTKLDNDSIYAGVYSSSMLINTLDQEHEVRGW